MSRLGRAAAFRPKLGAPPPIVVPGAVLIPQQTASTVARTVMRRLSANQPRAVIAGRDQGVISVAQGQAPLLVAQPGRILAAAQGQSASVRRSLQISQSAGNHQAAIASQPGHTIQASVSTNAMLRRAVTRVTGTTQPRALSLLRIRSSPTVAVLQPQAAALARLATRTTSTGQAQAASTQVTSAHFAVVILAPQSQSPSLARALTRHLQISQGQSVALGGARFLLPAGIASTAAVGRPTVILVGQSIFPAGIPSSILLGTPTVGQAATQYISPNGWAETELFGTPSLAHTSGHLSPSGIPPSSAVGTPIIIQSGHATPPRNYLIDRLTREVYPWPINHATEDSVKTLGRRLTRSGISASGKLIATRKVFLIRHPTHPGPVHLILHGSFLDRSQQQYATFIRFFNECDDRTFDYIDASGDSYHIAITQFDARRKLAAGREDGSYFTYSLEVEVLEVNQGAYAGIAV